MFDSPPSDWNLTTLGEVVRLQRGHDLPSSARSPGVVPVVGSGDADGWHNKAIAKGPGVVIGRATNLGRPKFVESDYWPLNTTLYVTDFRSNDERFIYYLFKVLDLTGYDSGSVQPMLNRNYVQGVPVLLPPLSEQRAMAAVLGALDDKLKTNQRVAIGAYDLAIAAGIEAVDSSNGAWCAIEDVADVVKGVSYKSEDLVEGLGWLVGLKCAGRDGKFQADGLKPYSGASKPLQVVDDGDILVAHTDLTQRAEVIGRPIRICRSGLPGRFVASLDFAIVRPKPPLSREVLLAVLSTPDFRSHALGYCNGTTVLHMNSRAVPCYQFHLPSQDDLAIIDKTMTSLLRLSDLVASEARALTTVRDALLPRLLSGELRVREAEALVEDVV